MSTRVVEKTAPCPNSIGGPVSVRDIVEWRAIEDEDWLSFSQSIAHDRRMRRAPLSDGTTTDRPEGG